MQTQDVIFISPYGRKYNAKMVLRRNNDNIAGIYTTAHVVDIESLEYMTEWLDDMELIQIVSHWGYYSGASDQVGYCPAAPEESEQDGLIINANGTYQDVHLKYLRSHKRLLEHPIPDYYIKSTQLKSELDKKFGVGEWS